MKELTKQVVKQNVKSLYDKDILNNKKIIIYGTKASSFYLFNELNIRCFTPYRVMDKYKPRGVREVWGITYVTPEEVLSVHDNDIVILITAEEYLQIKSIVKKMGYKLNKQIFVNYTLTSRIHVSLYKRGSYRALSNIILKIRRIYEGRRIYKQIRNKYGETVPILVCNYTGTGDIYIIGLHLQEYIRQNNIKDCVLVCIGYGAVKILNMFGYTKIVKLTINENEALSEYVTLVGEELNTRLIIPMRHHLNSSRKLAGGYFNLLEMYTYQIFGLQKKLIINHPILSKNSQTIDALIKHNKLERHNTIMIAPYAYSVAGYSHSFWCKLAERLQIMGFVVCTMCHGDEQPIKGTIALDPEFEDSKYLVEECGYFLGLRSGFCDVISNANCNKLIIYNVRPHMNGYSVYDYASLRNMNMTDNVVELIWGMTSMNDLVDIISLYYKGLKEGRCYLDEYIQKGIIKGVK